MADQEALEEFEREGFVFTVLRDGEVHSVEVRKGDERAIPVCAIYHRKMPANWSLPWAIDPWRPWIDQQARRIIAEAEHTKDDRPAVANDNQNP
ncbi:hypothetical protein [Glycomyces niveus]|uniref:Uncharacterized protein n=1 Tax=Glycomyces niveus TaxID=2820287 RepID=A0ABS3U1Y7_9ACTN|nr:hypothetical protein [Glycomyces sp. NEAU-S30]MBO3732774.1 hypothetical protein [Glycomyces sp. NEAU-S30]